MKKIVVVLIFSAMILAFLCSSAFADGSGWEDISGGNKNIKAILIHPGNQRIIYAGSKDAILKTEDAGKTWKSVLSLKGSNKAVNYLQFEPANFQSIYAATGGGLYHSRDSGIHWDRIFKGKNYLENECNSVALLPGVIFIGTKAGLFMRTDKTNKWYRAEGRLGESYIYSMAQSLLDVSSLYVASADGVFKTKDKGASWKTMIFAFSGEGELYYEEQPEEIKEDSNSSQGRFVAVDDCTPGCVYIVSSKGIMKSPDSGENWHNLSCDGLAKENTQALYLSRKCSLFTVVKSRIFGFLGDTWQELAFDPLSRQINYITFDYSNTMYVASERGLFRSEKAVELQYTNTLNVKDDTLAFQKNEPGIEELQQVAMRYAEVEPGKIEEWRKLASKKAWLPHLNVGVNRDVSDLWHWESGSTTKSNDDVLMRGNDCIAWDVSLTWDFGELIWNSDQMSIDSRSRLTVQLRQDILDEVTRLYFERIRLAHELESLSLEDQGKRFEKRLKIQEATATLNALTGGYLSKQKSRSGLEIGS